MAAIAAVRFQKKFQFSELLICKQSSTKKFLTNPAAIKRDYLKFFRCPIKIVERKLGVQIAVRLDPQRLAQTLNLAIPHVPADEPVPVRYRIVTVVDRPGNDTTHEFEGGKYR